MVERRRFEYRRTLTADVPSGGAFAAPSAFARSALAAVLLDGSEVFVVGAVQVEDDVAEAGGVDLLEDVDEVGEDLGGVGAEFDDPLLVLDGAGEVLFLEVVLLGLLVVLVEDSLSEEEEGLDDVVLSVEDVGELDGESVDFLDVELWVDVEPDEVALED